jgi:phosphoglycolate phosphatase-like HAD superfamily hydrolase
MQTNINHLKELKRELSTQFGTLGDGEFELAVQTASETSKNSTDFRHNLIDAIENHRQTVTGPNGGLVSFEVRTADAWKDLFKRFEESARRELLASSAEIKSLDKLQADALEARRKAEQKEAEITRLFNEFQALPDRAKQLTDRLAGLTAARKQLADEQLTATFIDSYRDAWTCEPSIGNATQLRQMHAAAEQHAQNYAALVATRAMRPGIIDEIESTLTAELKEVENLNVKLARQLGRSRHNLSNP